MNWKEKNFKIQRFISHCGQLVDLKMIKIVDRVLGGQRNSNRVTYLSNDTF
jgi:hypothetical protein